MIGLPFETKTTPKLNINLFLLLKKRAGPFSWYFQATIIIIIISLVLLLIFKISLVIPDGTFYNFRAPKSVNRRLRTSVYSLRSFFRHFRAAKSNIRRFGL